MLITFFLIMIVGAFASLFFGIKYKHWIGCAIAAILFLVLAFSAFRIEVPSGGVTLVFQEIVIVLLCWAGAGISTLFTLLGAAAYVKEVTGNKQKKQETGAGG